VPAHITNSLSEEEMPDSAQKPEDKIDGKVLLDVLAQIKEGDFTARMPHDWTGIAGKVADGLNDVIVADQALGSELARVSQLVGKQGELGQRIALAGLTQRWSGCVDSVNCLIDDLVRPTVEMQRVIGAVADGDLSKKVSANVHGEMLELKNTINAMVDQLNGFISELTRVTREVGTEGKLGQAAAVTIEVSGVWKDLTDNVNLMAANLTGQLRNIAEVTTAVANGDLSKKISIDVKGEFLELKNTVNAMVDQLNAFAGEVTRVAREVGVEGKLGGQAQSKEVAGVWKDLTDNVNQLAANLTNQVRAIAEVAIAVTDGDLTRQVSVEASGEVAALQSSLNEMIRNLRETTRQNDEQDWLKTNLERFTRMLQGQRNLATTSEMILSELAPLVSAQHAVFYSMTSPLDGSDPILELQAGYGYEERKHLSTSFRLGEGLVGQCGKEKKRILLTDVPSDYVRINSGLGDSAPLSIIVVPVLFEGSLRAVIELASFSPFSITHQTFLERLTESIGLVLSTIEGSTITETLLEQAQSQAEELRTQQGELRESNDSLERQGRVLAERNIEAEQRTTEIEQSKRLIEEKVNQLSISSKYKSEFIANMSHELRTPLNSLLILAEQLESNPGSTMTDTQVQYASVILASGRDLLDLLNGILDLAKAESGTFTTEMSIVSISDLRLALLREFEPVAQAQGLGYSIDVAPDVSAQIVTDPLRLRQILKNLLANAFKFTEKGAVRLCVSMAEEGWSPDTDSLTRSESVVAFAVSDSGIGVNDDDQRRIFEAFAQADGTTSRGYGGSGLGLSISRELVGLLGGEITLASSLAKGSTFTVYLPGRSTPVVPAGFTGVTTSMRSNGVDASAIAGSKVLLVDDDAQSVFAVRSLLEQGHADVTVADGGVAALSTLERMPEVDIVLMDIMMPGMDGYTAIRAIRAMEGFASLPVIAVTGKVVSGERERCIDAGASDYIPKPIGAAELFASLSPWLPRNKPLMASVASSGSAEVPAPERSVPVSAPVTLATSESGEMFDQQNASLNRALTNGVQDQCIDGRSILVVDDDYRNSFALSALLARGHATVTVANSGADALAILQDKPDMDIVLMDIMMPGMDGYETMREIRMLAQFQELPIIALTGKVVPGERQRCIDSGANDYVSKPVNTVDLLDALRLWLPAAASAPEAGTPGPIGAMGGSDSSNGHHVSVIAGTKILMVDDDLRNIFSLSALLERGQAIVTVAESGAEALLALEQNPDIEIVLMDIMMPIMDGYTTIRAIRALDRFNALPIIAVTGKVVPGERQRCIDAGASDYVPKPVDTAELVAALRPWLPKILQVL
jgi:CheY-like chemotaxis protein/signal transduction histidine kinase/HAMP domain-containing protein